MRSSGWARGRGKSALRLRKLKEELIESFEFKVDKDALLFPTKEEYQSVLQLVERAYMSKFPFSKRIYTPRASTPATGRRRLRSCIAGSASTASWTMVFQKTSIIADTPETLGMMEGTSVVTEKGGVPMAKLKPCPFCGGTKLKIDSKRTFQYGKTKHCSVTVRCMQCHARSPVVGINMPNGQYNEREICESAVIEAWNRRVDNE